MICNQLQVLISAAEPKARYFNIWELFINVTKSNLHLQRYESDSIFTNYQSRLADNIAIATWLHASPKPVALFVCNGFMARNYRPNRKWYFFVTFLQLNTLLTEIVKSALQLCTVDLKTDY